MAVPTVAPTGVEQFFGNDEIIVSKTDLKGILTYTNEVFLKIAGYEESEVMGESHNCIRHPDMPRTIFRMLWDRIQAGHEIFAYVMNLCKNGDHYWVLAHVTPSTDASGRVIGYHSMRRVPDQGALSTVKPLYQQLLAEEARYPNRKDGIEAGVAMLQGILNEAEMTYDEWIWSLEAQTV